MIPLFLGFARVGLLGFGGGQASIPLMETECVDSGWVTHEQFLEGLAAGNALPGPISTKMALYVGWHEAGWSGAAAAFAGLTLPSSVLMLALSALIIRYRDHPVVEGGLRGVKPAVIGMLVFVAYEMAPAGLTSAATAMLAVGAFALLWFRVHPGLVMIGALSLGALVLRG
jgi:chromate transporter